MYSNISKNQLLLSLIFLLFSVSAFAQKMTTVRGTILDADTKEPLPFVNVSFKGTSIGTTTDFDGKYVLESLWATTNQMEVSFIGYETQVLTVVLGERQVFDIALQSTSIVMNVVEVKAKKGRYKRRDNPAVELMREVIARKDDNRIEASNFYEMDKYEKIQFDINNFDPEKLKEKRAFRKYQFILDNVDTSKVNGKPFLPFFIQESSSKVYFRKNPEDRKEHRSGVKVTGMKEYVDDKDLNDMLTVMYQSVNIYQNDIRLLDLSFMSPLSTTAIGFYRFYIVDSTGVLNGTPVTKVSFYPENSQNIAFKGDLYITRGDSAFAVIRADFGTTRQINVNFVQELKLKQEFTKQPNGVWARTMDQVTVDFSILKKGTGIYGTRTATYRDFVFDKPVEESLYAGTEKTIDAPDVYKKDEAYWQSVRHEKLSDKEQRVYQMIDTIQRMPSFKRMMNTMSLVFTGYKAVGPVDVGPIANFYSFNPVEGTRVKLGGETNLKFLPKLNIGGYGAYGFKDERFKYGATVMYSFRDDFKVNPRHYVRALYQKEVNLVGQILLLNSPDNFFLSFQRGTRDRMLLLNKIQGEYFLETPNHVSYQLTYTNTRHRPIGATAFRYNSPGEPALQLLDEFTTSDVGLTLRFAPNEKYIQGRTYRTQLFNKHPIFLLKLNAGLKDVLGGDYAYQSASLNVVKRFYLSFLGVTRMDFEAGKIWGNGVPYFLLNMPRANQTYTYRTNSFNMMNYQEFVSDEYALIMLEHNFNGWIFNKIPLLRKLKLREAITFKAIYGRLTDSNNPEKHPEYIQFLNDEQDRRVTYTLQDEPYIEAGIGVGNIFKVLRFDLVRRFNYLDNPEVPSLFGVKGLGLRFRVKLEF